MINKIQLFTIDRDKNKKLIHYPLIHYDLDNLTDLANSSFLEELNKNGSLDFLDRIKERIK